MKALNVRFIEELVADKNQLLKLAEVLPENKIDCVSWKGFPYRPNVTFKIAQSASALFIRFDVEEKALRVNNFASNEPVYEDSCVEFFISFRDQYYYNLEFNAIGVALVGYGTKDKDSRKRLTAERISQIKTYSHISKDAGQDVKWNLMLYIPLALFEEEKISTLKGNSYTANFYKCGDELPEPHYVSWSPIQADEPNFHLPEFFGTLIF
ncbi:carbohydrate-binding family 9-like protein [Albibacterium profundi]|uniref:Carbohydrate-binding family 9-like protein n=1 Tax=Albibacterium profundi TaxID=3134906 RepID=A0ABV5CAE6_9SPHI